MSFMPPLEYNMKRAMGVAPLTLSYLAMITLSNLCLKYVEASFYQVTSLVVCSSIHRLTFEYLASRLPDRCIFCST